MARRKASIVSHLNNLQKYIIKRREAKARLQEQENSLVSPNMYKNFIHLMRTSCRARMISQNYSHHFRPTKKWATSSQKLYSQHGPHFLHQISQNNHFLLLICIYHSYRTHLPLPHPELSLSHSQIGRSLSTHHLLVKHELHYRL